MNTIKKVNCDFGSLLLYVCVSQEYMERLQQPSRTLNTNRERTSDVGTPKTLKRSKRMREKHGNTSVNIAEMHSRSKQSSIAFIN